MVLWIRSRGWLLGVLAIASFAMLFRLGVRPIENWDEGIHGGVSLEMVEDGDWLTPHYAGGTYFRKPPLKVWASAIFFHTFGANAWTLRIPSAFAGIATALLVAWWMWEWRRNRLEAFLAGVIVATMRPIFFHAFRTGEMDGMLTLFTTAALYGWWKHVAASSRGAEGNEESRTNASPQHSMRSLASLEMTRGASVWFVLCGAAIGFGIMTKSAGGLLPLPIIVLHALVTGTWRHIRARALFLAILAAVAIVLPWHLAMNIVHGRTFWEMYLGWHVVKRIAETIHNESAGTWWYFPTLAKRFTPYTFWLVPAILWGLREIWERRDRTITLLLIGIGVTFIGYSAARTKFDWYLLPLYPLATMLVVAFVATARGVTRDWLAAVGHGGAVATFAAYLPTLFPDESRIDAIVERWYAPFLHPLVVSALIATGAIAIIVYASRRWSVVAIGNAVYGVILAIIVIPAAGVTVHHLRTRGPEHPFAAVAAHVAGTGGHLVSYGFDYKQHPAGYFLLRSRLSGDVRILDGRREAQRTISMLRERPRGFLLTETKTELPEELRTVVGPPIPLGPFALRERW